MSNPEHLKMFEHPDREEWEDWRYHNKDISPDLSGERFERYFLKHSDFNNCIISDCLFRQTLFKTTPFRDTNLVNSVHYYNTYVTCYFVRCDFSGSVFHDCNFRDCYFTECDFSGVEIANISFINCHFSSNKNIDLISSEKSSNIDYKTIFNSDSFPDKFLISIGTPSEVLTLYKTYGGKNRRFFRCFISHSSEDGSFAKKLHDDLQGSGISSWYAPENLKLGERIRDGLESAINESERIVLVLSSNSIKSHWVESEMETALELERKVGNRQSLLIPITLDEGVWTEDVPWVNMIKRERNIGNFSNWEDGNQYRESYLKLLDSLKSMEKKNFPREDIETVTKFYS